MISFADVFAEAARLILSGDGDLAEILWLSLRVTLSAVSVACLIGVPLGALLAIGRFPGRGALSVLVDAGMGLPPVVAGLALYLVLSASGPLGPLQLLYTPAAMVIAQAVLATPIVAALTREAAASLHAEYDETLRAMGAGRLGAAGTVLRDARGALATAALAGFGRATAEVGAVMIVGGNIDHVTRMMTTAIALETSRGNLALALALGMVLMTVAVAVNAALALVRRWDAAAAGGRAPA